MPASLQTEEPRRNPATDYGGQHDGDINLRFLMKSGPTAGDTPYYTYSRDTLNPTNQTSHHAFYRLTQRDLHNNFRTTTTIEPMANVLKNS
jgi:hypothetical protein